MATGRLVGRLLIFIIVSLFDAVDDVDADDGCLDASRHPMCCIHSADPFQKDLKRPHHHQRRKAKERITLKQNYHTLSGPWSVLNVHPSGRLKQYGQAHIM
ncbi:hypothetical protein V5799_020466 [Amblyomma americanum]|uniref:Secreted protein n=1 Tax=Amblyomma americanum TaxID=6943 RepID=A0AAQ4EUM8_AMBAM